MAWKAIPPDPQKSRSEGPARCDPDIALGQVWGRPEVKKIQGSMSQQGTDAELNFKLLSQLIVD